MDDLLKLLAQNAVALNIAAILLVALIIILMVIYVVAFFQGREVSFWPPKIGKRKGPPSTSELEPKANERIHRKSTLLDASLKLKRTDIVIESNADNDCKILGIAHETLTEFIVGEVSRHPILLSSPFSSLPLVFSKNIILLSWDGSQVCVERLLSRNDAYPSNDAWFSCVSLYRQATTLPYRGKASKAIISESETQRIINLYRKLLRHIKTFISLSISAEDRSEVDISMFESLLDEVEFTLVGKNPDFGIVQLEALLSSIHKFLLSNAPQATSKNSESLVDSNTPTSQLIGEGEKSILVVDDEKGILESLSKVLIREGYSIGKAENGYDALKAILEHDYDLVITDLHLPVLDGREVVIGTRRISPRSRILLITAYSGLLEQAELIAYDKVLLKPYNFRELLKIIEELLDETKANPNKTIA